MNTNIKINLMLYKGDIYENIISFLRFSVKIKYLAQIFYSLEIYEFIHKVLFLY